jgi:trk system potassium uptake protein TrkH
LARRVTLTMLAIEAAGAVLLFLRFVADQHPATALWWSVFLAISAFNNAGYDLFGQFRSLTGYQTDAAVLLPIAGLVMLGGISYMTLSELALRRSFRRMSVDGKVVLSSTAALWALGIVVFTTVEWGNPATFGPLGWQDKLLNGFFQSVTVRSAGFNAVDIAGLTTASQLLTIGLMFIGGAAASTAGGIRLNTFSLLLFAVVAAARGTSEVVAFKRTIPMILVLRALSIAVLSVAFAFGVTFLLTLTEGVGFVALLFEVVSAFGGVGQSAGIASSLTDFGSAVLAVTMVIGRLGPLSLAVFLAGRVSPARIRYAEEPIRIG